MGEKLLYHIESSYAFGWYPVKVRRIGDHNFAALTEWFDDLDICKMYATDQLALHGKPGLCGQTKFRITDHLGNVHWKGDGVQ